MGQYWLPVNLDRKEFIDPYKLGSGLKLWEQLANNPGTGAALVVLCAAMPEPRGGGDLDVEENWHGRERTFPKHNVSPGPMPENYPAVARRTIGRWAGDRIALVGDYAEDIDLMPTDEASKIYGRCRGREEEGDGDAGEVFIDITEDVAAVIEHELGGKFIGDGWKDFEKS